MSKIKRALMGLTALLVAFSMSAVTACTVDNNGNNGDNGNNTEQGNQGGGGNGGNQGGENQGGGNEQGVDTATAVANIMAVSAEQTYAGVTANYSLNSTTRENYYACYENGFKKLFAQESKFTLNQVMNGTAVADFVTLNADLTSKVKVEERDADGNKVVGSQRSGEEYSYTFTRGGKSFYYTSEEQVTDFSTITLLYGGDASEVQGGEGNPWGEMLSGSDALGTAFNAVINMGSVYNSVSFANGKLTVNLNKVAYNAYNEVLGVIDDLTETSTVGEVLETDPVKNLIDSLTYGRTARDIYDTLIAQAGGQPSVTDAASDNGGGLTDDGNGEMNGEQFAGAEAIFALLPVPEEGASVHSYLVTALKDEDFSKAVLGTALGFTEEEVEEIGTLYDLTVLRLVLQIQQMTQTGDGGAEGGTDGRADLPSSLTMAIIKATIKGMFGETVSATKDKFTLDMQYLTGEALTLGFTGVSAEFTVNDRFEIVKMRTVSSITSDGKQVTEVDEGEYQACETKSTGALEATVDVHSAAPELTDIDDCAVETYDLTVVAGKSYFGTYEIEGKKYEVVVTAGDGDGQGNYAVTCIAVREKGGALIGTEIVLDQANLESVYVPDENGNIEVEVQLAEGVKLVSCKVYIQAREDGYCIEMGFAVETEDYNYFTGGTAQLWERTTVSSVLAR